MNLEELKQHWELLGERDPMWAVLSVPEKKGGKWDEDEFYATGVNDIRVLFATAEALGLEVRRGRALDFGCGVGRMSQALCPHFASVTGVDVSAPMLAKARERNRHPDKCQYVLNTEPNLAMFADGTFDLSVTYIVLQHMKTDYAQGYLKELCRVTAAGGILLFQIPTRFRLGGTPQPEQSSNVRPTEPVIEMHATPLSDVARIIDEAGMELVSARSDGRAGPEFLSHEIWAVRP